MKKKASSIIMKKSIRQKGFTVVEALIILGVTSILFVSTALLIGGQIDEQDYRDSMFKAQQETRKLVKTVENGDISENTNWTGGISGENCVKNSTSQGMDITGVSDNCSIIGTVIWFDSSENNIKYKYVGYNSTINQYYNASNNGWGVINTPGSLNIVPKDINTDKKIYIGYSQGAKNLSNVNETITPQSIQLYIGDPTENGSPIILPDQGLKVCFEGKRQGALLIGKNKSKDVEVIMQDDGSGCEENFISYYSESETY